MSLELNSCVLIDYGLWAAKSEGRQWVEHCIEQCIEHPPEPRSGLCPELLADFRILKPPGCSQGAQRAVFCAVRVADFLAEGAGWGASPGRGGELGCQAQQVLKKICEIGIGVSFVALSVFRLRRAEAASAVWIPHWHSEPLESQGTRAAKGWTNGNLVEREKGDGLIQDDDCILVEDGRR